ncbi:MAG TPA: hypothetical protein VF499_04075 [Afipia sp.]
MRRNGNLVSRLIGDLRNPRNAVPNPVHRQRVNFVSLQQEALRAKMDAGFVSSRDSIRESAHELTPDHLGCSHENKTESDSPIASRLRSLPAQGEEKIFLRIKYF